MPISDKMMHYQITDANPKHDGIILNDKMPIPEIQKTPPVNRCPSQITDAELRNEDGILRCKNPIRNYDGTLRQQMPSPEMKMTFPAKRYQPQR